MSELRDAIIAELQGNLPVVAEPYQALAERIGCTEAEVLETLRDMKEQSLMRRVAAVLRHQQAGYNTNAMVAWQVPEADCDRIGELFAGYEEVSHCYWRETPPQWPYNLFCMIHAKSPEELDQLIKRMETESAITDYQSLSSIRELKKTSVVFR